MPKQQSPESDETPPSESAADRPAEQKNDAPQCHDSAEIVASGDATRPAVTDDAPMSAEAERESLEPTELELLKAEVNDLTAKLVETEARLSEAQRDINYAKAETQTATRRGREDATRAINRTKREMVTRLMVVSDTFHQTAAELEKVEKDDRTEVVVTAVQMAINEFEKALSGEGLELTNPLGEPFDPQFHEAQATVPTASEVPGTIIDVLRVGYLLNGNVLRAPQVVVAAEIERSDAAPDDADES